MQQYWKMRQLLRYTIKDEADASVHMGNKSKDQELVSEKASVLEPLVEKDSRPVNTAIAAAPIVGSSSGNDLLSVSTVELSLIHI